MQVCRRETRLQQVPHALLQVAEEEGHQSRHAIFGPADAALSPDPFTVPSGRQLAGTRGRCKVFASSVVPEFEENARTNGPDHSLRAIPHSDLFQPHESGLRHAVQKQIKMDKPGIGRSPSKETFRCLLVQIAIQLQPSPNTVHRSRVGEEKDIQPTEPLSMTYSAVHRPTPRSWHGRARGVGIQR
jgi:hypothetical protein